MQDYKLSIAAVAVIVLGGLSPLAADPNSWETNGPFNARVITIEIHPNNNRFIFSGTIEGGVYKSENGGLSWQHVDDSILEKTTRVIKFHPCAPDTVFLTTVRGIFRSNDCGLTWSRLDLPFGDQNEYTNFAINPFNPQIMMAGSWGYILKSTDGGNYWDLLDIPYHIEDMEFDPFDSNTVYAATHAAATGKSVIKSTDLGVTWQIIGGNLDSISYSTDLDVDPYRPGWLYLSRSASNPSYIRCVSKTTNGGAYWIDITPPGLTHGDAVSITISHSDSNTIYLCTNGDGLFRSRDGGLSWARINEGLYGNRFACVVEDTVSDLLYLGTYFEGIYRSTDGGDSWEKISQGINQTDCTSMAINSRNNDSVYVATLAGLYFSSDGCQNWRFIDPRPTGLYVIPTCLLIDKYHPEVIFVGYSGYDFLGRGGIIKSTNGGTTWLSVSHGLPINVSAIKLVPIYEGFSLRYLLMAASHGLFKSDSQGDNWGQLPTPFPENFFIDRFEVSQVNSELMFAIVSTYTEGTIGYRSTDGGASWQRLTNYPAGGRPLDFVCDPVDPNIVYANWGIGLGIFRSTDRGESWTDINNNLPRHPRFYYVSGIAVNSLNPQNIIAVSFERGFYFSNDCGQSWQELNEGLSPYIGITEAMFAPNDTTKIYLFTHGFSVWSITRTTTSIDDDSSLPKHITLHPNYPNPFNTTTVIGFSLPKAMPVSLDIYDILGRKVVRLFEGTSSPGEHSIPWDASGMSSGIYFYRLTAGDDVRVGQALLMK